EKVEIAQKEQQEGSVRLAFAGPSFTYPEPGAGLIREAPTLIAPEDLYVNAGRGALRVFKTDEQGNLVFADPEEQKSQASRSGGYGMSSGYGGMSMSGYGGMMGNQRKNQPSEAEQKKQQEEDRRRLLATLAGTPKGDVAEQIDENIDQGLLPEQTTAGYRWVSIVGSLDHE